MPSTDQIKITVYFMDHILAHLGAGPGWVVTLLCDRCFASENESRNRVIVKGGYAEIASWLGINRVKTVWEWLTQKKGGKYVNPVFRLYVCESANERDFENRSRIFYVLLEEIAMEMLEAFATGKGLVAELLADGANFSLGMADFSLPFGANFRVKSSLTLKPNSQTLKPNSKTPQPLQDAETEIENLPAPTQPPTSKSGGMGNMAF